MLELPGMVTQTPNPSVELPIAASCNGQLTSNVMPLKAAGDIQMGLFGLFGKKRAPSDGEAAYMVASKIASTLDALVVSHPEMLANPYARVVLRDDWNVHVAADKRDPAKILGANEVSFYFLREDEPALQAWMEQVKDDPGSPFARIATDQYAGRIVRTLMANVQIV